MICCPGTTTSPRYLLVISSLMASLSPSNPSRGEAAAATAAGEGWRYSWVPERMTLHSCSGSAQTSSVRLDGLLLAAYVICAFELSDEDAGVGGGDSQSSPEKRFQKVHSSVVGHGCADS